MALARIDHRFNGEGHPRLQDKARVRVAIMEYLRIFVEHGADAVAAVLTDYGVIVAFRVLLDDVANIAKTHAGLHQVDGHAETFLSDSHEALCVDPITGYIYETEDDRYTSGFYRFRPRKKGEHLALASGGLLEMLRVKGTPNADLQRINAGDTFDVEWVPIDNPRLALQTGVGPFGSTDGQTTAASGPFYQGWLEGGARFRRLEGCWFDDFEA